MKQRPGIWIMSCIGLWLVLLQTDCANAQEVEGSSEIEPTTVVPWASSLVSVREKSSVEVITGVVVKAEDETALVLTTFEQPPNAEHFFSPTGKEVVVSINSTDGKLHEMKGKVSGVFGQVTSMTGSIWQTVFVEVKHKGLRFTAVPIAESVPGNDATLMVVGRHCPDSKPASNLQNAKLISDIDPATSHDLLGQLSGTTFWQQTLSTVHDDKGALVGIGSMTSGPGQGGFGGGGGNFSLPDPLSNGFGQSAPAPISFVSVVDRAEQLRYLGVPVSDAAIKLQNKRLRVNRDIFGRPVQSQNLQITWSDDHKELHGFSSSRGEWAKLNIDEQDVITPIVGNNVGAVILNGKIAGYSPTVGRWDVLTLSAGSKAVPAMSYDVATVRDGKDYYTFASSSGTWTSPTNPDYQQHSISMQMSAALPKGTLDDMLRDTNTHVSINVAANTARITGIRHHVLAAERVFNELLSKKSVSAAGPVIVVPGPGVLPESISTSEQQSLSLAKQLRSQTSLSEEQKSKLTELVTKALDEKLQRQRDTAKSLRQKLETIEQALQSRQANRERIIERRVEELLDPNIDWTTLQPSLPASVRGLPTTGTAIRLSGQPHISAGLPGRITPGLGLALSDESSLRDSLKKARSSVVDHASAISAAKKELADLQQPSAVTTKQRQADIRIVSNDIDRHTKKLKTTFSEWEFVWRQYEAQLAVKQLDVQDAETRIELAREKLQIAKEGMKKGYASSIAIKEIETQFKLQETELQRARNAFESIQRIGKDHPELDPVSFDSAELLMDKKTETKY